VQPLAGRVPNFVGEGNSACFAVIDDERDPNGSNQLLSHQSIQSHLEIDVRQKVSRIVRHATGLQVSNGHLSVVLFYDVSATGDAKRRNLDRDLTPSSNGRQQYEVWGTATASSRWTLGRWCLHVFRRDVEYDSDPSLPSKRLVGGTKIRNF
jgi:hypothetical protein